MPTYAIGDIQGCREQLEQLLEKINFDPASDQLWIAGDLVNRGPDSLGTLRLLFSIRNSLKVVLGNHDLHMLAASYVAEFATNNKDTFQDVLHAEDSDKLLNWLRMQPLLQESDHYFMCHAGIHPEWSLATARTLAAEVALAYQATNPESYFRHMYGNQPEHWSAQLESFDRLRFITNVFTRMRFCDASGALKMHYKATITDAPDGLIPWYDMARSDWQDKTLLIGHWAALQLTNPVAQLICLDTGCVWGNKLSAFALETKQWFQVSGI